MSAYDRARWDKIYADVNRKPFPPPNPLLFEVVPPPCSPEARALDLAGGLGQNALWLANQGYIVDLMDISRTALTRARDEMMRRNLRNINLLQFDVDELELERERYDLVCVFRYLKRSLLPQLAKTIIPGGRIIYETFNLSYLEVVPGFNPDFLLHPGELAEAFAGWKILVNNESEHVTQFVALNVEPDEDIQFDADSNVE